LDPFRLIGAGCTAGTRMDGRDGASRVHSAGRRRMRLGDYMAPPVLDLVGAA
jgi:hypothetical protein